jgi:hypothetical protein
VSAREDDSDWWLLLPLLLFLFLGGGAGGGSAGEQVDLSQKKTWLVSVTVNRISVGVGPHSIDVADADAALQVMAASWVPGDNVVVVVSNASHGTVQGVVDGIRGRFNNPPMEIRR